MSPRTTSKAYGAKTKIVDLSKRFAFPRGTAKDEWWQKTADRVRKLPFGEQRPWGIPFSMSVAARAWLYRS